jgi:hypothetical protein
LTQRFHDYFYPKVGSKEIDMNVFFKDFGIAESTKYSFFSGMRSGQRGITSDHVQIAWEKYGVRPDYLFGVIEEPMSMVAEPAPTYAKSISTDIRKIRKLLDELEKKIENK